MVLKEKKAIVTGASRGIGRAIALELAKECADIAFNYLKSKQEAESLVKEIKQLGREAFAYQVDIKDHQKVKEWIEKAKEDLAGLDILVNNAGIVKDKALMMMEESEWRDVIDTNLTGVFNTTRACIVTFLKQKRGDIVNITSVSGIIGLSRQTNYASSKAGIIGFTKSLAREVAAYNIRVNAIAPGFIQTDMLETLKDEAKAELLNSIPLHRFGRPEEVARAVIFILSDNAKYITGQVVNIDGGLAMK